MPERMLESPPTSVGSTVLISVAELEMLRVKAAIVDADPKRAELARAVTTAIVTAHSIATRTLAQADQFDRAGMRLRFHEIARALERWNA